MRKVLERVAEKDRVRLAVQLNYPDEAPSGGEGTVLRTCVVYDLPPSRGTLRSIIPSEALIGDLRILIHEVELSGDSETRFDHVETTLLLANGKTPTLGLNVALVFK